MTFYNEFGQKTKYELGELIGQGQYAKVYRLSNDECIKIYKRGQSVDADIIDFISYLDLKNFCKIYRLLYNRSGTFKGYTMKWYDSKEIDILTMPIDYTLENLYNLYESLTRLTGNNIFVSDMHTGNAILNEKEITIIDLDLYTFSKYFIDSQLHEKNSSALRCLFQSIFFEALHKYHSEIETENITQEIKRTFKVYSREDLEQISKKLIKHKYPIDYFNRFK